MFDFWKTSARIIGMNTLKNSFASNFLFALFFAAIVSIFSHQLVSSIALSIAGWMSVFDILHGLWRGLKGEGGAGDEFMNGIVCAFIFFIAHVLINQ